MSEHKPAPSAPVSEGPKQPYVKPVLMRHGTVVELTQGVTGGLSSDVSSSLT
jgi:hypothetical protein